MANGLARQCDDRIRNGPFPYSVTVSIHATHHDSATAAGWAQRWFRAEIFQRGHYFWQTWRRFYVGSPFWCDPWRGNGQSRGCLFCEAQQDYARWRHCSGAKNQKASLQTTVGSNGPFARLRCQVQTVAWFLEQWIFGIWKRRGPISSDGLWCFEAPKQFQVSSELS